MPRINQRKSYQIHRQYFDKRSGRFHEVRIDEDSAKYMDRVPLPFLYRRRGSITEIDPAEDEKVFSEWVNHIRQFMRVVCRAHGVEPVGRFCWVSDKIPADLALAQNLQEIHPFNTNNPVSIVCWVAQITRLLLLVIMDLDRTHGAQVRAGIGRGEQQRQTQKLIWEECQIEADKIMKNKPWIKSKRELSRRVVENLKRENPDFNLKAGTIERKILLRNK